MITDSQRAAIGHVSGNLQLIACAGSGKTEVVARRVVNLLRPTSEGGGGCQPVNLIAFTFTDKAAAELKERIHIRCREHFGDMTGLAEMYVGTIHGFCLDLLKSEVPAFMKYKVLNEVQQTLFVDRHSRASGLTQSTTLTGLPLKRFTDTPHFIGSLNILREDKAVSPTLLEGVTVAEHLTIVHEDLRPHQNLLTAHSVGVPHLNIERIAEALKAQGMTQRVEICSLPPSIFSSDDRAALWTEIALLLNRQERNPKLRANDERILQSVSIAPGRDGAIWPCGELYWADDSTVTVFGHSALGAVFVNTDAEFAPLVHLCPSFDTSAAIAFLQRIEQRRIDTAWDEGDFPLRQVFEWFEDRRQQILADEKCKQKLVALSLFPSNGVLRPLKAIALPGNFADPLNLSDLVDLEVLRGRREIFARTTTCLNA